jgi:hypothetical protein
MNQTSVATTSNSHRDFSTIRIHSVGGLGLAGLLGGPLALAYLAYGDLKRMGRTALLRNLVAWFLPLAIVWLYCSFSTPGDFISQLIVHLPQAVLWWIVARHLLLNEYSMYENHGGRFLSKWRAARFGFFFNAGLKVLIFAATACAVWRT